MCQEATESILTATPNSNSMPSGGQKAGLPLLSVSLVILLIYALWSWWQLASIVTIVTELHALSLWMNWLTSLKSDDQAGASSGKPPDQDEN